MWKKKQQSGDSAECGDAAESPFRPVIGYLKNCIGYEVFIVALSAGVVYSSGSHTAIFPLLFAVGGLLCLWLMLYTMKAAAEGDVHRYPYGTGRLENVCAILLSVVIAGGTLVPFIQVMRLLLLGETHDVKLGSTFVLLFFVSIGNALHAIHARSLRKVCDNPILNALNHLYRSGAVRDGFSCLVIGLCWLLKNDNEQFMTRLDLFATVLLSSYSFYHFLPQIWFNFRALADFPLSEESQLKVMGFLARHFDAYEMPGRIYTTHRGSIRVFEVELAFKPELSVGELIALEQAMRDDFQTAFPGCVFRIIPQIVSPTI